MKKSRYVEESGQPSLAELAEAQGISPEELEEKMAKMKAKLKPGKKRGSANNRKTKVGPKMTSAGFPIKSGNQQLIAYDLSDNPYSSILGNGSEKGDVTATQALAEVDKFVEGITKASQNSSAKIGRKDYKELRKKIFNELAKAGVKGVDNDILKAAEVTDDMDDATEKKMLNLLSMPYGYDEEYDVEDEEGPKNKHGQPKVYKDKVPISGPYKSLISSFGLSPYSGKVTRADTGGSRYMDSNPFQGLMLDWNMDKLKNTAANKNKMVDLLDGAEKGTLTDKDLDLITDLYEAYLIDKRIANEISKSTGVDYEPMSVESPSVNIKDVGDAEEFDMDLVDMDMALDEFAEESRNYSRRKIMKLTRQDKQRQKLVIEETKRHFDKKKKALINFVEESVEGLTEPQSNRVKTRLKGKSGKWIKNNINSVIRKVVEEGLASKRRLIRENREVDGKRLIKESRGENSGRRVVNEKGESLVEESRNAKSKRRRVVEEEAIVQTNDDYSKASQYL